MTWPIFLPSVFRVVLLVRRAAALLTWRLALNPIAAWTGHHGLLPAMYITYVGQYMLYTEFPRLIENLLHEKVRNAILLMIVNESQKQ